MFVRRIACLLTAFALSASMVRANRTGDASLEAAEKAVAQGQHREAIEGFTEALRLDAKRVEAYVGRAKALWSMGELEQCLADFRRAIALAPDRADLYLDRGEIYGRSGDSSMALADIEQALRLDPKNPRAFASRGYAFLALMNTRQALADFETALELNPRLLKGYIGRAGVYRQLFENELALADYATAERIDPNFVETYIQRSAFHRNLGEYKKAFDDLQTALVIAPRNVAVHSGLAWLAAVCPDASLRNGRGALAHARLACELSYYKDPAAIATLAAAHAESGDFAEAVRWQMRYLEFDLGEVRKAAGRERLALYSKKQPYRALRPAQALVGTP